LLTITIPFSGKIHCLERVLQSLKALQAPGEHVNVVLLDNSSNPFFLKRLNEFAKEPNNWTSCTVLSVAKGHFGSVADIYTFLAEHVKGDWLSLEDDVVEYPPDTLLQMRRHVLSQPDIGIVAAYMESRRGYPGPMAWSVETINGLPALKPLSPLPNGMSRVCAVHMGCTLIRPPVYRNYTFRTTGEDDTIIGQDIYLCIDAKTRGLDTAVIWNLRAGHSTPKGTLYTLMPPQLTTTPELKILKPKVSIITPTCGRVMSLGNLITSLKEQTYQNYEHLICNDGQSRAVSGVVEKSGDLRTRYFELGHPFGFSGAPQRNALLQKASGELVVFVDDDALLKPHYLETMVNMWSSGSVLGIAQIELEEDNQRIRVIPPNKEDCVRVGNIDTLCFYVDTSIAKAFYWDLFEEHDLRYWLSILNYTRGSFAFNPTVVGRATRSYGQSEKSDEVTLESTIRSLVNSLTEVTPEAEALILKSPEAVLTYIANCLDWKPWEKAHPIISTKAPTAIFYITNVLHHRLESAEHLFEKDSKLAVAYAKAISVRWKDLGKPQVEEIIRKDPNAAEQYAREVIKGRWEEAESFIRSIPRLWNRYRKSNVVPK
jgi:glycosyltransferase involved in cell wall biosynthesis